MDADPRVALAEVRERAEGVADHEGAFFRPPERDLAPDGDPRDPDQLERRAGDAVERDSVVRHPQAARKRLAVAVVPVNQLDDAARLAEGGDAVVQALDVHRVDQPYEAVGSQRVRGPLQRLRDDPAEAAAELIADPVLRHGEYRRSDERSQSAAAARER